MAGSRQQSASQLPAIGQLVLLFKAANQTLPSSWSYQGRPILSFPMSQDQLDITWAHLGSPNGFLCSALAFAFPPPMQCFDLLSVLRSSTTHSAHTSPTTQLKILLLLLLVVLSLNLQSLSNPLSPAQHLITWSTLQVL